MVRKSRIATGDDAPFGGIFWYIGNGNTTFDVSPTIHGSSELVRIYVKVP